MEGNRILKDLFKVPLFLELEVWDSGFDDYYIGIIIL